MSSFVNLKDMELVDATSGLKACPSVFYILLGTVGLLDAYIKIRFGNISHRLSCDTNRVAYKFPPKFVGSEEVGHGIPIT
jgi:hypothetical protein